MSDVANKMQEVYDTAVTFMEDKVLGKFFFFTNALKTRYRVSA